jgi:hypothetical protein
MEPTKFEEHSREKFEERVLQPSPEAWNRLEQMLEAEAPAKKKSGFTWYAIAAAFIGFVIIASIVFNSISIVDSPAFVEESTPTEMLQDKDIVPQQNNEVLASTEQDQRVIGTKETVDDTQEILEEKKTKPFNSMSKKERLANNEPAKKNINNKNTAAVKQQNKREAVAFQKPKEAMAYNSKETNAIIKPSVSENRETSIALSGIKESGSKEVAADIATTDVDALLKAAQQKIRGHSGRQTQKVDAMALLGDVELEMEQTLQEKIFYAVGQGLDYVKTSFVDRGN